MFLVFSVYLAISPSTCTYSKEYGAFFIFVVHEPDVVPTVTVAVALDVISVSAYNECPFEVTTTDPRVEATTNAVAPAKFDQPNSFRSSPSLAGSFQFSLSSKGISSSTGSVSYSIFFTFVFSFFSPFASRL